MTTSIHRFFQASNLPARLVGLPSAIGPPVLPDSSLGQKELPHAADPPRQCLRFTSGPVLEKLAQRPLFILKRHTGDRSPLRFQPLHLILQPRTLPDTSPPLRSVTSVNSKRASEMNAGWQIRSNNRRFRNVQSVREQSFPWCSFVSGTDRGTLQTPPWQHAETTMSSRTWGLILLAPLHI